MKKRIIKPIYFRPFKVKKNYSTGKPNSSLRDDPGGPMRRTASMDAIYLKGHWPKDGFHWNMGTLHVNEATQVDNLM